MTSGGSCKLSEQWRVLAAEGPSRPIRRRAVVEYSDCSCRQNEQRRVLAAEGPSRPIRRRAVIVTSGGSCKLSEQRTPWGAVARSLSQPTSSSRATLSQTKKASLPKTQWPTTSLSPAAGASSGSPEHARCAEPRENATKIILPDLPPIPEALQGLQPIEQHLIAMARISQVLLDKLPAGGPSAQWGRMYAVLMEDPLICDVLAGATLQDDGTVLVEGVQGLMASPARLDCLHKALVELKSNHRLYKANPAVDEILTRMGAILTNSSLTSADALKEESGRLPEEEQPTADAASAVLAPEAKQGELEMTYLVPKHFKAPNPEAAELQKVRGMSALGDDMDAKFFPHLFPTGTGGWQDQYGSFSQYARKRLLGLDPRFESSAAYIMWLLEMHTKKRLTGNINVRIGGQPASHGKTK